MKDDKSKRKDVKGNASKEDKKKKDDKKKSGEDKKKKKSTEGESMAEEPVTSKIKEKVPGRRKLGPSGQDWSD